MSRGRHPARKRRISCAALEQALSPDLGPAEREYCFAVAMKYVRDEEAAADIAQEALLSAHRHRDSFRGDSRYSTWLYRIAATTSLMWLRKARRRGRELTALVDRDGEETPALEIHESAAPDPAAVAEAREQVDRVARRLEKMGDKYGRIFRMRYLEGYTEGEIAERLDLSLATVKTRVHRARVAVKETLAAAA